MNFLIPDDMPDKKLTDAEVKKALECKPKMELVEMCAYLQAEVERLKKELLQTKLEKHMIVETMEEIKAEAYKEFAERLKAEAKANEWNGTICGNDIDNLLNELVGDASAEKK